MFFFYFLIFFKQNFNNHNKKAFQKIAMRGKAKIYMVKDLLTIKF